VSLNQYLDTSNKLVSVTPNTPLPIAPSGTQNTAARAVGGLAAGQFTVSTTAGIAVPARAGRSAVTITNLGTTDVFIGPSGVTATTGHLLPGIKGASITVPTSAAIYAIIAAGSQAVSYLDTF